MTKYRNPAFTTPELVQEMKDILLRIAQLNDVTVEELEVMPEHVHMLISCPAIVVADNRVMTRLWAGGRRIALTGNPFFVAAGRADCYTRGKQSVLGKKAQ